MKKVILWILAFALTGTLLLSCVCLIGRQVIAPGLQEDGAQVSDAVIREEKELARQRITELADLYGFTAEPVIEFVDEETLRGLHKEASQWYSRILTSGKAGEDVEWNPEGLEEIFAKDPAITALDRDEAESMVINCTAEVRRSMLRMVLPMRQQVIGIGLQMAAKKVDIANLLEFFTGTPWALLAVSAFIAGLIALIAGRVRASLKYIGSALGAAAIVLAALVILYLTAGIQSMIREASAGLTIQYQDVASGSFVLTGVLAAVLLAGCGVCLALGRKYEAKA